MAPKKTKKGEAEAEAAVPGTFVTVVAKQAMGRCRAGFQFTQEPREVAVTEDQLAMIQADPVLAIVSTREVEAPAGAEA